MRSILFLALLTAGIPTTAAAQADSRAAANQPPSAAHGGRVEQPRTELPAGAKSRPVNGYDMAYVERGAGHHIFLADIESGPSTVGAEPDQDQRNDHQLTGSNHEALRVECHARGKGNHPHAEVQQGEQHRG